MPHNNICDDWSKLLAATLETWAHQVLYARHVYPRSSFGASSSFLGVRCQACRHPPVVAYIRDTVQVAVPALRDGVANELELAIVDVFEGKEVERELYRLRFTNVAKSIVTSTATSSGRDLDLDTEERALRSLVQQVQALRFEESTPPDTTSFRLTLHVPTPDDSSRSLLTQGLSNGTWDVLPLERRGRQVTPLHRVASPACTVHFTSERRAAPRGRLKDDRDYEE